jgi:CRP-like cAMP-binding protein
VATEKDMLLEGLSDQDKSEFLSIGKEKEFAFHEMILQEGTPGRRMHIIHEGRVSIWLKGCMVGELGPGDTLGTTVILAAHSRTATVRAESRVVLKSFDRDEVMGFFRKKPPRLFQTFFINISRVQVNTLRKANERILQLEQKIKELGG